MHAIEYSGRELRAGVGVRIGWRRRLAARWRICPAGVLAAASLAGHTVPVDDVPGGGFALPIDCRLGTNCWIVNYPDAAPGTTALDFNCHHLTCDGHKGTDFAVRDLAAVRRGVAVVAAAAGRVLGTRDGMGDVGGSSIVGLRPGRAGSPRSRESRLRDAGAFRATG